MAHANLPREFKFVGGPSRKRRRCAPGGAADKNARRSASQRLIFTARQSTVDDTGNAPRADRDDGRSRHKQTRNDSQRKGASPGIVAASRVADQQVNVSTNILPPPTEVLESLLEWPLATGLTPNADDLDLMPRFLDPSLANSHLYTPTSPLMGLINDPPLELSPNGSGGDADTSPNSSSVGNRAQQSSHGSTEDIDREHDEVNVDGTGTTSGNFGDISNRLFAQYEREYCVWPVTQDFEANPFRCDIETGRASPLLWHSILALSYKHINRETGACLAEATFHKEKAIKLLEELESDLGSANTRANLLNGLLIVMTLDCATSAQGPWISHLRRAQKIIEAAEIFGVQKTPRLQAQVDMLVWWDVTLGLTTRQGFVLSGPMVSSVFNPPGKSTFYNVSGCPEELFKQMYKLGRYARELELTSHMTCVNFDMGPVHAVEAAIREFHAPQYDDENVDFTSPDSIAGMPEDWSLDPLQAAHYVQDLYHCAQAWRYSLLVYIERVFKRRRGNSSNSPWPNPHDEAKATARISLFARKTLDNVLSCRRGLMLQKQLLLPVFLAACETEDEELRAEARDYCSWWGGKTRYDMFITTLGLLEEVWAASAVDEQCWWGSLIDQKSGFGSTRQYLFG